MAGKIIPFPGNRRGRRIKPPTDQPERFLTEEYHVGRRGDHTQKKFVPEAMDQSLIIENRWKPSRRVTASKGGGRIRRRSPSTLRLNNSNVNRKAPARGRAK